MKDLSAFKLEIKDGNHEMIQKVQIFKISGTKKEKKKELFGEIAPGKNKFTIEGNMKLKSGKNFFSISVQTEEKINLNDVFSLDCSQVIFGKKKVNVSHDTKIKPLRFGFGMRQHGDDNVHTYRIPGLATTNKGTLIGVYDIRRNGGVDLQEDIDVGMHRSTDGGQSWEPMKVIMDMGEWGGLPQKENGIGDPSVLVDRSNNTIWVAAVWAHGHPGKRNWWASRPGLEPIKTSQFVLVKSEDDGLSWSEPINITKQVKTEEWYLMLQGPGKGITMKDGTLVFPAQFKDKNDMPHSTIISSKDHGKTWTCGTGAKSNTTEAQVIELNDGSLMLNMRDNRNGKDKSETNGRSVSISKDFGKTWTEHATSRGALQEPTCMASLIKENFLVNGEMKSLVLFSNPNSKKRRDHMTIKVSMDDGESWSNQYQLLLDEQGGRGYSCMSKIDDETIGILYEGSQADLVFQIVKIEDIFSNEK
jgi:sialidase-1